MNEETSLEWRGPLPIEGVPELLRPYVKCYQARVDDGHLTVLVGKEPQGWHLSISHRLNVLDPGTERPMPGRIPTYEELKMARYTFCPMEIVMAQLFPPEKDFVNLHPTTLHLWELPVEVSK